MDIYEKIGGRLREARRKKNISAKRLASFLGRSLASISNYEKAKRWISLVDLERAAEFLGEPLFSFIEETPGETKSQPPHTLAEREILKAFKKLGGGGGKELPQKTASLLQKMLGAKYTLLFLIDKDKELQLGGFSRISTVLLKKLEDLLTLTRSNLRFKLVEKLQVIFKANKPYLITDIASSFLQFGAKRLSLLAPSLIDLAKFKTAMLLPFKSRRAPVGLLIACFEDRQSIERWEKSELLVFFAQYAAEVLENARLLGEAQKKTTKVRASYKIALEEPAPTPEVIAPRKNDEKLAFTQNG